jgi:hypothetical protein
MMRVMRKTKAVTRPLHRSCVTLGKVPVSIPRSLHLDAAQLSFTASELIGVAAHPMGQLHGSLTGSSSSSAEQAVGLVSAGRYFKILL